MALGVSSCERAPAPTGPNLKRSAVFVDAARGMLGRQCDRARELTQGLLAGRSSVAERRELSAHTHACAECARELERALRQARMQVAVGNSSHAVSRSSKRWRVVRNLALPCFALVLVSRAFPASDLARVELLAGEASLRGAALVANGAPARCARADVVATGADSRARLCLNDAEIVLGSESVLSIEKPSAARARLHQGQIEVTGSACIASIFGFVALDDACARIAVDARGVSVEVQRGQVSMLDSRGEVRVEPGAPMRLVLLCHKY